MGQPFSHLRLDIAPLVQHRTQHFDNLGAGNAGENVKQIGILSHAFTLPNL
jgi:hypothetical protein